MSGQEWRRVIYDGPMVIIANEFNTWKLMPSVSLFVFHLDSKSVAWMYIQYIRRFGIIFCSRLQAVLNAMFVIFTSFIPSGFPSCMPRALFISIEQISY